MRKEEGIKISVVTLIEKVREHRAGDKIAIKGHD